MKRRLVCAAAVLLLGAGRAAAHDGPHQTANHSAAGWPLAPFVLVDQHGRTFTQERLQGRWTFVLLGGSHCAASCNAALSALVGLRQRIARAEVAKATQVLYIVLDGGRAERLREPLAAHDPAFIAASADRATLDALAEDLRGGNGSAAAGALLLIGPDASLRAEYPPPFDVPALTADFLKTRVKR